MTVINKFEKLRMIHQKKMGVLLIDAREKTKKSVGDCAEALRMDEATYQSIENGEQSITLPQLEVISSFLRLPVNTFFSDSLIPSQSLFEDENEFHQTMKIRNKTLATKIRIRREEQGLSVENLAKKIGTDPITIEQIESGTSGILLTYLEQIAFVLDIRMKDLFTRKGSLGQWHRQQEMQKAYEQIPEEVQTFINNPSNEPYLRLAMHLSSMSTEKLRAIAEGLLEITF